MTLIQFIKTPEARLLFGKKEIEIILKQILGKRLISSETTRLSRDIRKKFIAIEKASRYKKEFLLKKNQENKNIIKETKDVILENFEKYIEKIILFGSHARGDNINSSDIDMCVKLKNNKIDATKVRRRILGEVREGVDVQIYSLLPKKVKDEIKKDGKVIFKNE